MSNAQVWYALLVGTILMVTALAVWNGKGHD